MCFSCKKVFREGTYPVIQGWDSLVLNKTNSEIFMKRALKLASKGLGKTSPNPMVGAVIVKDGEIAAEGYHKKAGQSHAEINAIEVAGTDANGADLYVTLEPCSHFGKTPPCADAVINAGIKRVFVAMKDPNPKVSGNGIRRIEEAGIEVQTGLLEGEAKKLNEIFVKYITTGTPFVTLKAASTLDGHIATKTGTSKWITGEKSRHHVHRMRDKSDAILVGIRTVQKDDPSLTTRLTKGKGKDPIRVILDENLLISMDAKVITTKSTSLLIIATTEAAPKTKIDALVELGATLLVFDSDNELVPFRPLMERLGEMEITSLIIEGGSLVNASALRDNVVDKVAIFYAPKIFGGSDCINIFGGSGIESLSEAVQVKEMTLKKLGEDFLLEGYIH